MIAATISKVRTALRLSRADKVLVAEAAVALLVARLRSGLLPFRMVARHLGGIAPPNAPTPAAIPVAADDDASIRAVRWAIGLTAPAMPFRAVCLQQALAARTMLTRRGIPSVLYLGVGKPGGQKLEAHAWLTAGTLPVTGYPVDPALQEVGHFVTGSDGRAKALSE